MTYRPISDLWLLARARLLDGHKLNGAYPGGFVERARALLGVQINDPVLHVCGGKVRHYPYPRRAIGPNDRTLDLDRTHEPDFVADARQPYPLNDGEPWAAVLADPPYSEADADRYPPGAGAYPAPNLILRRGLDAVAIGGRVGILHYIWPSPPAHAIEVAVIAVPGGRNMRIRQLTVFERIADAPPP